MSDQANYWDLLKPIPGDRPSGRDLRYTDVYFQIQEARRAALEREDLRDLGAGDWGKAGDWQKVVGLTTIALANESKDLLLAAWLTEAKMRLSGLRGINEGLALLRELTSKYWAQGLFPEIDEDGAEGRAAVFDWVDRALSPGILLMPVTARCDSRPDFSAWDVCYRLEEPSASSLASDIEAAFHATPNNFYETTLAQAEEGLGLLEVLERENDKNLYHVWHGFARARKAYSSLVAVIRPHVQPGSAATDSKAPEPHTQVLNTIGAFEPARIGPSEYCGRDRFFRKLEFAEKCTLGGQTEIAKMILEELASDITRHQLDLWESNETISRVWQHLYRCFKGGSNGNRESQDRIFSQLCRVNPWLAAKELRR